MKRLLASTLFAAATFTAIGYVVTTAPLPFVRAWWEAGASNYFDPLYKRHRMADSLVQSQTLIGLSRGDIEARLGPPPETDGIADWDLVYPLGTERGWVGIDSEWLVIRINASGSSSEARVVRD